MGKQGHFEKAGAKATEDRREVLERRLMKATSRLKSSEAYLNLTHSEVKCTVWKWNMAFPDRRLLLRYCHEAESGLVSSCATLTYNGPDGDPERGSSHVFMGLVALAYCSLFADGTAKFSAAQVFPVCVYE